MASRARLQPPSEYVEQEHIDAAVERTPEDPRGWITAVLTRGSLRCAQSCALIKEDLSAALQSAGRTRPPGRFLAQPRGLVCL